jgi:hypothetical protein
MKKVILLILPILFFSCEKDDLKSPVPLLEFISITPEIAQEYEDEIIITISYFDGDGDLGENDPNVKNLFLTDNRNNITYEFRIQQLSPDNSTITIEGNLDISLSSTGITDSSNSQIVTFDIYVVDRANHQSNIVTSNPITIIK